MSNYDLINLQDEFRSFQVTFNLWPKRWQNGTSFKDFIWNTYSFNEKNRSKIPFAPGLYTFVINPKIARHPHRYLCYIGRTESLQDRYGDYLSEAKSKRGRPKLVRLLNKWKGHLEFSYVLVDRNHLKFAEDKLINMLLPPFNDQVSSDVYRIIGAF